MNKINIIKVVYILGAIIDGIWSIVLAFPSLYIAITNSQNITVNAESRIIFIIASSLMLGWAFLLLWGYKKPIERRGILLLTAFPVVTGIFIGVLTGFYSVDLLTIIFAAKTFVIIIGLCTTYLLANKVANQKMK